MSRQTSCQNSDSAQATIFVTQLRGRGFQAGRPLEVCRDLRCKEALTHVAYVVGRNKNRRELIRSRRSHLRDWLQNAEQQSCCEMDGRRRSMLVRRDNRDDNPATIGRVCRAYSSLHANERRRQSRRGFAAGRSARCDCWGLCPRAKIPEARRPRQHTPRGYANAQFPCRPAEKLVDGEAYESQREIPVDTRCAERR